MQNISQCLLLEIHKTKHIIDMNFLFYLFAHSLFIYPHFFVLFFFLFVCCVSSQFDRLMHSIFVFWCELLQQQKVYHRLIIFRLIEFRPDDYIINSKMKQSFTTTKTIVLAIHINAHRNCFTYYSILSILYI